MNLTLDELARRATAWCATHGVVPANGQVSTETQPRTLRYYRTLGLLDAPAEGGAGGGYGARHLLQACAVRVLQAHGLPLSRIQSLLFGRSDDELQDVLDSAEEHAPPDLSAVATPQPPAAATGNFTQIQPETWQSYPLSPDFLLIARRPGFRLSPPQQQAIQAILTSNPDPATTSHPRQPGLQTGFNPVVATTASPSTHP